MLIGGAAEAAAVALFLLSDGASYVTGPDYFVDGGEARLLQSWSAREIMSNSMQMQHVSDDQVIRGQTLARHVENLFT